MKFKAFLLCAAIGCLLLFAGCEPNVNNGAGTTGTTPISTTPRATTTTSHTTTTTPHTTTTNETTAVGGTSSTAFLFTARTSFPSGFVPLSPNNLPNSSSAKKIGWGLGKDVDDKNRPADALSAQQRYGGLNAVFIDSQTENRIYLTFDEGYENGYTPQILGALKEKGIKATFFVTYDYCRSAPELIKRMIAEGHEVGNHSYSHPSFPDCSEREVRDEIQKLHDYVKDNFNYEMRLVRFPKGEFSEKTLSIAKELGYTSVFWSFAYVDWQTENQPSAEEAYAKITSQSHQGAVILLHAVSKINAALMPDLLDFWIGSGLKPSLFE